MPNALIHHVASLVHSYAILLLPRRRKWFAGPECVALLIALTLAFAADPAQAEPGLLVSYTSVGSLNTVSKYDAVTGAAIQVPFFSMLDMGAHPIAIDQNNRAFVSGGTYVGVYNATTGAAINPTFITGPYYPQGLALDGHNHVFVATVATNNISEYDATTGGLIDPNFTNGLGLNGPAGMVVDGNNHLFVANSNGTTVGEYNATTGALINANFIDGQGLDEPYALALDGHNHLLVGNSNTHASVGEFDATTGAHINAFFLPGPSGAGAVLALALDGSNHLFVLDFYNRVGEYDATTGATINESFVTGLSGFSHYGLAYVVPEPSTFVLAIFGLAGLAAWGWRRRKPSRA
jgi:hypothetical protein